MNGNEEVWCPPAGSYEQDPSDFSPEFPSYKSLTKIEFTIINDSRVEGNFFFVDAVRLLDNDSSIFEISARNDNKDYVHPNFNISNNPLK
jgi:hypothetical protein